jgi:ATP-binding cassette subfamily B protein
MSAPQAIAERAPAPQDRGRGDAPQDGDGFDLAALDADPRAKDRAGRAAMRELLRPVSGTLMLGRVLSGLSAVLAVAPYVALVDLGAQLLTAWNAGEAPDSARLMLTVNILLATFLGRLVLYFLALGITHFADARLGTILRDRIVATLAHAPLSWFSSTNSGRVRKVIQDDTRTLHTLVAHAPVETTSATVMPLALFAYAMYVDWRLGLLAVATFPLYAILQAYSMRDMATKTAEMDTRLSKVSAMMVEFVSGITVVKAFGRVGRAHESYATAAKEFTDFYLAWCEPLLKGSALSTSAISAPVLLLVNLGGGAAMVGAGWVSPVDVLACSLIALVLPASIEVVGTGQWAYQMASASALRLTKLLDLPLLPEPDADAETPQSHDIGFDHVSFAYGQVKAVDDVTLTLPSGSITALIGPSGSGKSTLATLVARFADPDSGTVTIGGVDLRRIPTAELYRQVAFVLQNPQLLRMSIRDNIRLARPDATDEQVREAARAARIDDVVTALPDGYDTVLGAGTNLSGGETQRIAIARAILADAPILLLDEATAFVDPESEAEIQRALDRLVKGRTVLVIAHRPASVIGADRIVVMERGRVVAQGTHRELAEEPHYRSLWAHTTGSDAPLTHTEENRS